VKPDEIEDEAVRWFTRMQSADISIQQTLQWQSWMSEDPAHAEAYRRIEETWHRLDDVPRPPLLNAREVEEDDYDGSIPVAEWNARKARARPRLFAIAASVALALVAAGAVAIALNLTRGEILETRTGENRSIVLADGSRVVLGGSSRLRFRLGDRKREMYLLRGQAFFEVARDAKRPFVVAAGQASVEAVGTEFDVTRNEDRIVVSVLEGRVAVQPEQPLIDLPWLDGLAQRPKGPAGTLDAGRRTTVAVSGIGPSETANAASITGWQQGQLSFDNEPLRYAVEAVNRYSQVHIEIVDPRISDLRISGTAIGERSEGWISSLEAAFDIKATRADGKILLSLKNAG
jgi:transmembrane sensor